MPYKDKEKAKIHCREKMRKYRAEGRYTEREQKYYQDHKDVYLKAQKKYREANKDKVRERHREYCQKNRKKLAEKTKEYYRGNKSKMFEARLKQRFGLTLTVYNRLLAEQDGKCAICQEPFIITPRVDHNHRTGEVRGLLCRLCNTGLGHFRENKELLKAAVIYLK